MPYFNHVLLRTRRLDRGWAQETLAELAGIHLSTYKRYESGRVNNPDFTIHDIMRNSTLEAIARALEMDQRALLTDVVPEIPRKGMNRQEGVSGDDEPEESEPTAPMDPVPLGGAVPLHNRYYVERRSDAQLLESLRRRDMIVLIKGPRQIGKTSLLARGLASAKRAGIRTASTDLQSLNQEEFQSPAALLKAIAEDLADQLMLKLRPDEFWNSRIGPNQNFQRYVGQVVLEPSLGALVWGMDEIDRLFFSSFASEVFALFRSWHNARALISESPWQRLSLVLSYATEAHLFITDMNQSPFNVGTRIKLEDFDRAEVDDLNLRHGRPLTSGHELERFSALLGGHPYLVQRGLYTLSDAKLSLEVLEQSSVSEEGPFGEHLRRLWASVSQEEAQVAALRSVLLRQPDLSPQMFYRLRSAGVLKGAEASDSQMRCQLYRRWLERYLQ